MGKIEIREQKNSKRRKSIDDVSDYWGETIPYKVLLSTYIIRCGLRNVEVDLKDIARIGLGVTNMVIEYLDLDNLSI